MDELKRIFGVWLKWAVIAGACFGVAAWLTSCGCVAGIGRDLTAMADGMAGDSSANAAAIRGKDE